MPTIYTEGATQMNVHVPQTVAYGLSVAAAKRRVSRSQLVVQICEKWLAVEKELPKAEEVPA